MEKRKLLIDTDGGLDDANALLLALSRQNIEVVAITTICGNTTEHQAAMNILRVLQVADNLEIPVYRGASKAILGTMMKSEYHGRDGLGDYPDNDAPSSDLIQTEHAVNILIKLVNENPGVYELVCLGPLTNIALAIRMDPEFGTKLSKCWIMGGNYQGVGNTTPAAEFNFRCDPEAAFVVLHEMGINIMLMCWEACVRCKIDWDTYESLRKKPTKKNMFLKKVEENFVKARKIEGFNSITFADLFLMAIVVDYGIVASSFNTYCIVETSGVHTRGAMLINRRNFYNEPEHVTIMTDVKQEEFIKILRLAYDS